MSDYLPEEIVVNILHRATVKSIGRCACVCKAWNSIIKDHDFMFRHFSRNNDNDSLFIQFCSRRNERPLKFKDFYSLYLDNGQSDLLSTLECPFLDQYLKKSAAVVGTCNGLVCLADDINICRFIIWNPSVRRYVTLPEATLETNESCQVFVGFGFDSRNKDFKVVRIVNDRCNQDTQVEVYSLAIGYWIKTTARAPPFFLLASARAQSFMNGILHWPVRSRFHNFILSFDLVEEKFGELMLPQPMKKSPFLSILEGGSLLVFDPNKEFKIWMMKDYGYVESWAVVFRCDLRRAGGIGFPLALTGTGKLVLQRNNGAIVLLDRMTNLVKDLGVRGAYHPFAARYVESLVLLNQEYEVMSY